MSPSGRTRRRSGGAARGVVRPAFLDPARIEAALAQIAGAAARAGTHVALAGGCALQLYGSDRFTQDVDLLVDGRVPGLRPRGDLSFGGVRTVAENGVPVDLIARADQYAPLYADALTHAQPMRGVPVLVVTLPYLAAMKLAAGRDKDESDLAFVLCDTDVAWPAVRAVVKAYLGIYAVDELTSIRQVAAWQRKTGRRR